jgi:hypothetical protein
MQKDNYNFIVLAAGGDIAFTVSSCEIFSAPLVSSNSSDVKQTNFIRCTINKWTLIRCLENNKTVKENKYQEYQTRSFQEYESSIILF